MKSKIKILVILVILFILYIYVANITLIPDSLILMQGEKVKFATVWGINVSKDLKDRTKILQASSNIGDEILDAGKIEFSLNLFNNIPLRDITVNVIPKTKVVPLGNSIGLKLYTEGVLVVGMAQIEGKKPYEGKGIEQGDRITYINNKSITCTSDLVEIVSKSKGEELQITYEREEKELKTSIIPAKTEDNEYKLGLWVRDAAAGVGTLTFYIPDTNEFASLGHGITDIDTGDLITIASGELVTTNIMSIKKGENGKPGELKGSIDGGKKLGEIYNNTSFGIFGKLKNTNYLNITQEPIEVASRDEIKVRKSANYM